MIMVKQRFKRSPDGKYDVRWHTAYHKRWIYFDGKYSHRGRGETLNRAQYITSVLRPDRTFVNVHVVPYKVIDD